MGLTYSTLRPIVTNPHDWVLGKILELRAHTHGDKPFLQYMEEPPVTFAEVNRIVNRVAHGLAALGVRKGDRVLLMLPNCLEYLYVWWAANKLGAIEVPVNNAYKGYFLEHVANNSGAKVMVVDQSLLDRVRFSEERLQHLEHVVVYRGAEGAAEAVSLRRLRTSAIEQLYSSENSTPDVDVRHHDLSAIMYTSGTTGPSKGVMMPHAQCHFFSEEDVSVVRLTEADVYYTCNPFFHANAQLLTIYPCLIAGASAVIYPYFSASEWLQQVRKCRATVANFLGVMMDFVYRQPARPDDADNDLRVLFAAPTPPTIVEDFKRRFGVEATVEAYGMTEICLPVLLPYGEYRPGAAGKVVGDWFEVKLVDSQTDEELPLGQIGEVVVRHKQPRMLNAGYFGMPDKTAEAYRNLWFHTGDALRLDEDGFFYFVDRVKDALRRRGENISSYEVEAVINDHPAVAESAVIAVKSEVPGGEDEVKACLVLRERSKLSPEDILRWCEERMPYFAVPRYVEFVAALPKTPNLKIQKHRLREDGVTAGTWDRVKEGFRLEEEILRQARKEARKQPSQE
ncbi:MAG: AMP-binding protein [Deltaproteobacteria bacterium]|nr:AMP-binding protein [Deltaproteobacteria bacterium]